MTEPDRGADVQAVNPEFINVDPLKPVYEELIVESPDRIEAAKHANVALLCIDLQYLDAARGYGVFADVAASGVPLEAQEYYFDRLERIVLPSVRRLQDSFRAKGLEVIHTRIQSLTKDGRDRSPGHKRLNLLAAPGSREADFLEDVQPVGDEIVINKTASGVFSVTNLEYVLRNLGIDTLYAVGVYTDECVSTTVRDASDLGFFVNLVDDGCATVTERLHEFTIATLRDRYTRVVDVDGVIEDLEGIQGEKEGVIVTP